MQIHPTTPEALRLFMDGILTLSKIEHNGFRIDTDYLTKAITETDQKIKEQERILKDDPIYEQWRRWKGTETKLGSREQLGHVLYNILGFPVTEWCELSRKPKVDETTLGLIDLPFARNYIRLEKLKKIRNTYLGGIQREVVDGYLHPSIHLHTATSFRSSMSNPNLQNVSVRNKEANGIIRRAFIPREGRRLIEIDFSGVEVKGSACVTHDPVLIRYIEDSSTDMHRDMAMECYMVDRGYFNEFPAEAKDVRYVTKNSFVFPQFYGEYYVRCAAAMWKQIQKMNLKYRGTPMKDHLKNKGIRELGKCDPAERARTGTFEYHIREVEKKFWGERFKVYAAWKKAFWEDFLETGEFHNLTGFRFSGVLTRNQVTNYPVQSISFHILLWCLIEMQKEIEKRKMKSLLVNEIHDCVVGDVPEEEVDDFIAIYKEIATKRVRKAWKWIIVPLDVEVEVCPVGGSWFDKKIMQAA